MPLLYVALGCSDGEVGSDDGDRVASGGAFAVTKDLGGGGSPWAILSASLALALSSDSATQSLFGLKIVSNGGDLKKALTFSLTSSGV